MYVYGRVEIRFVPRKLARSLPALPLSYQYSSIFIVADRRDAGPVPVPGGRRGDFIGLVESGGKNEDPFGRMNF